MCFEHFFEHSLFLFSVYTLEMDIEVIFLAVSIAAVVTDVSLDPLMKLLMLLEISFLGEPLATVALVGLVLRVASKMR
jgi:hypothetical protein